MAIPQLSDTPSSPPSPPESPPASLPESPRESSSESPPGSPLRLPPESSPTVSSPESLPDSPPESSPKSPLKSMPVQNKMENVIHLFMFYFSLAQNLWICSFLRKKVTWCFRQLSNHTDWMLAMMPMKSMLAFTVVVLGYYYTVLAMDGCLMSELLDANGYTGTNYSDPKCLKYKAAKTSKPAGLVIGVLSARDHFMQRNAVRNTWAAQLQHSSNTPMDTRLVFVVGDDDCHIHPRLRRDPHHCQERTDSALALRHKSSWWSSNPSFPGSWSVSPELQCVVGLGIRALTDVYWDSMELVTCTGCGTEDVNQAPATWLLHAGTHKEPVLLQQSEGAVNGHHWSKFRTWNATNINYLLPADVELEIGVTLSDQNCMVMEQNEPCAWDSGHDAVQYTYVRLADGSVQPWTSSHCPTFTLGMVNGEVKCPSGWVRHNDDCYYFSGASDRRSWHEARDACEGLGDDSSLATVNSDRENNFISHHRPCQQCYLWIGLSTETDTSEFRWTGSESQDVGYTNWDEYEPNSHVSRNMCVEHKPYGGFWNDNFCHVKHQYVCKKKRVTQLSLEQQEQNMQRQLDRVSLEVSWQRHRESVQQRLVQEQQRAGDLLVVAGLTDTYSNLPHKLLGLIQWSHNTHPGYWLLKTDDDTHVSMTPLLELINKTTSQARDSHSRESNHRRATPDTCESGSPCPGHDGRQQQQQQSPADTVPGDGVPSSSSSLESAVCGAGIQGPAVFSNFHRLRDVPRFGKWAEYSYSGLSYPEYPTGAGYLLTESVVSGLAKVAPSLRVYQGEDVSMGVWLSSLVFPCPVDTTSRLEYDLHPKQVVKTTFTYLFHAACWVLRGLSTVSEALFLAQSPRPPLQQGHPPAVFHAPSGPDGGDRSVAASLVSVRCWLNSDSDHCNESHIFTPNLSLDQMDQVHRRYLR